MKKLVKVRNEEILLIEHRRAHNICIELAGVRMPFPDIKVRSLTLAYICRWVASASGAHGAHGPRSHPYIITTNGHSSSRLLLLRFICSQVMSASAYAVLPWLCAQ